MELPQGLQRPIGYYRSWRYRNTVLLLLSLALLYYFADSELVRTTITKIGELGYIGAFITGIFFVSVYTVAPASVVLYHLADLSNPLLITLIASAGAVLGDYLILRFLKDRVFHELDPMVKYMGGSYLGKMFHTPHFAWLVPFIGAVIIASPLPDELGISMLGLSKIGNWPFVVLAFLLNAVGIFIIVTAALAF